MNKHTEISGVSLKLSKFFEQEGIKLPVRKLQCLSKQVIDSIRRIQYIKKMKERDLDDQRADPRSELFDPLLGALCYMQSGHYDEACWLTFLAIHFGKNKLSGWAYAKAIYRGGENLWTWENINNDKAGFLEWLSLNQGKIKDTGCFGNHRKYESLNAYKDRGTGAAVISYTDLIKSDHAQFFMRGVEAAGDERGLAFDFLYKEIKSKVATFGRMATFDYLCMIGKLGLAEVEPNKLYLSGSTGPIDGARLLFGSRPVRELEEALQRLECGLALDFGMQVLEDAICNWQKSPARYVHFRG